MKISSTNRTIITPLTEDHFPLLYDWITDSENIMLWSNVREFPDREYYYNFLRLKVEFNFVTQFVITKAHSEKPIGTIFIHDQNFDDEYASISAYLIPEERKKTYGMEAYFLTFNYVFSELPIRKLYMDVFSYNFESIKLIEKVGFNLEGKFIDHRKIENGFADQLRYSFFKKDWLKMKGENLNLIK
jgi:RimJ/RimL family protein N-acetyltransferase